MSARANAFAIASLMSDPSAAAAAAVAAEGSLPPGAPPPYGPPAPGQAPHQRPGGDCGGNAPYYELDWSTMPPQTNGYSSGIKAMEGKICNIRTAGGQ